MPEQVQALKDIDAQIRHCGKSIFVRVLLWWLGGSVDEWHALRSEPEMYLVSAG